MKILIQREQAEITGTNKEISVTSRSKMKRLLKEPLLHFLVLGALACILSGKKK